jgi:hypothetical protein
MKHAFPCAAVIAGIGLLSGSMALAADLSVGPGQAFPRVEAALAAAVFAAHLPMLRKLVRPVYVQRGICRRTSIERSPETTVK